MNISEGTPEIPAFEMYDYSSRKTTPLNLGLLIGDFKPQPEPTGDEQDSDYGPESLFNRQIAKHTKTTHIYK